MIVEHDQSIWNRLTEALWQPWMDLAYEPVVEDLGWVTLPSGKRVRVEPMIVFQPARRHDADDPYECVGGEA